MGQLWGWGAMGQLVVGQPWGWEGGAIIRLRGVIGQWGYEAARLGVSTGQLVVGLGGIRGLRGQSGCYGAAGRGAGGCLGGSWGLWGSWGG